MVTIETNRSFSLKVMLHPLFYNWYYYHIPSRNSLYWSQTN